MTGAAIDISGVKKNFGTFRALDTINLSVKAGEFMSLLGASGCGKTTLLRIIAGLEKPSGGRILIDGKDVTSNAPEKRPTSLVFQRGALFLVDRAALAQANEAVVFTANIAEAVAVDAVAQELVDELIGALFAQPLVEAEGQLAAQLLEFVDAQLLAQAAGTVGGHKHS